MKKIYSIGSIFVAFVLGPFAFCKNQLQNKSKEPPFSISMIIESGKGNSSYSDADQRIEIKLINNTKFPQLVRRGIQIPTDILFAISSNGQLWNSRNVKIESDDRRGLRDLGWPSPNAEDYQEIAPGKEIFLTTAVLRKSKTETSYILKIGEQTFKNLKPGDYKFQFTWSLGTYDSDFASTLSKKRNLPIPWVGQVESKKIDFKLKAY